MSQTTKRRKRDKVKRRVHATKPELPKPTSDKVIYSGLALIGFFVCAIGSIIFEEQWRWMAVGYVALIAYLVNINVWHVYRGRHLGNLPSSLARIPLRFVGYGSKGGKPLEAAHDHASTLKAFFVSVIVSLLMVAVVALLLVPQISPWS
jgi:hypothetical protein